MCFRSKTILFGILVLAALSRCLGAQMYAKRNLHNFNPSPFGTVPSSLIQGADGNLYGTTLGGGSRNLGTVFKISNPLTSPSFSVIYSFAGGADGVNPRGVIQASDGNLYGTTSAGGPSFLGTVFRITNSNGAATESVLHAFAGSGDGANPWASLLQGKDGNLYGTTGYGGSHNGGTAFKISDLGSAPVLNVIYSFTGGGDGGEPTSSLIEGLDGCLYGTTASGGWSSAFSYGTVYKISNRSSIPVESVVYSFTGGLDGGNPTGPVLLAADGNLYGTTSIGGLSGRGTLYKITNLWGMPSENVIHSFGGFDGSAPGGPLIQTSDGFLYGTTPFGGSNDMGLVFRVSTLPDHPEEDVVHLFAGGIDGAEPSILIQIPNGDLCGVALMDGAGRGGTIFRVSGSPGRWVESVVFDFPSTDGQEPNGLIAASDGNLYGTTLSGGVGGFGTVFRISDPSGTPAETIVYNFTGASDGDAPRAALIEASDGNLYGTTSAGGANGLGTVFKISNLSGAPLESVIYNFVGASDGANPSTSLIQAADGDLYGTTAAGGRYGFGTVFRITHLSGVPTESVIYDFQGGADGALPQASLIQALDGALYGTTSQGGSNTCYTETQEIGCGTVFRIGGLSTSPVERVIYDFTGWADGSAPRSSLIQASDGSLYGTIANAGPTRAGAVFKIGNPTTEQAFGLIYSFTGAHDGGYPLFGLTLGTDGTLYGIAGGGDSDGGTVFKISYPSTLAIEELMYSFAGGNDGAAPNSLVLGPGGKLYGTTLDGEVGAGAVFSIDPQSRRLPVVPVAPPKAIAIREEPRAGVD